MTSLKQNCNEQVKAGEGASHSCCHGDERGRGEFGDHTCKQVLTWNQRCLERVKLRLKAFEAFEGQRGRGSPKQKLHFSGA